MLCPRCQTENPAQARFCMNCGEPVLSRTPADEARFARLAASTPEPLQRKLRTAVIQGEVRQVAVLLVDVVASTRLAEQLGPETYSVVINAAFDRIAPPIYRYEGTIARLLGDSLLAFFGAPVAHEDDPVRAVRTALEVIEAGEEYAAEVFEEHGVSFALRACLHMGEVVVNTQADSLQYEFDAQDGAVNTVSRLKFAAGPNTILITEPLYRRVEPFFECQPGEAISIRGSAKPVQVYTVKSMSQQYTRLRGVPGLTSPMVGREAELRTLLQQEEAVRAGLGRAVLITGEPGLGKTRLVDEWQKSSRPAAPDGLYWTRGRCMSFSEGQAFSLLVDWLRDMFRLTQAADEHEAGEYLTDRLEAYPDLQMDELRPVFAYLLSLPLEAKELAQIEALEPLARQARYVLAVQQLVRSLAQARPLVIVLEDLHWADPASTELFNRLLPLTDKLPLLLCLVSREEPDAAGWALVSAARQRLRGSLVELHLRPLTDQDSQALVANLLEIEALPDAVRALILQRTEGNPLFVEEVIHMLIEQGVIVRQGGDWVAGGDIESVEIPDILQSLLLARIDRLPWEAREALLVAAVIGHQFPVKVLAEGLSASMPEINHPDFDAPAPESARPGPPLQRANRIGLTSQLNTLESAGLVRIAQYEPEVEYLFRHALIQDAAYSLLLSADRTRLHKLVGETIERLYAGHLDAYAALLAYHFERAGDRLRAFEYHRRAGENALASYANREAEGHFRQALALTEARDQQAACLDSLGEALSRQSFCTKALEVWRQAIDRYLQAGNYDQAAQLYARSGRAAWWSGDWEAGLRICEQGLQAVGRAPGSHGLAMLIHEAGRAYGFNNQEERVGEYCQRALAMAEQLGAVDVQAEALTTRSDLPDRPISDSRRDLERAIELAEPAGQLSAAYRAHTNLGDLLAMQLGQQEQAYQHFMRAAEICRQQGFVREELYVRLNVVRLLMNRFELVRAEENLQDIRFRLAIVVEDVGGGLGVDFNQAWLDFLRGDLSKWLAGLERIRRLGRRVGDLYYWSNAVWQLLWNQVDACFWGHAVDLDELYELGQELLKEELFPFFANTMQSIVCSLRGEIDEARHYLTAAGQIMAPDWPNEWLFVEFSRFHLLLAEDQQDQALAVLEELLNSSILDAFLGEKMRVRSYQAEIYRRRGRPVDLEAARRIFREIEQFTGQVGVRYWQQIAQERLEMLRQEMLDQAVDHEQVSREMANARRVQASFLPQVAPEVPGWELAAKLSPARQTSGDFYDFIPLPEDRLAFLVADVADKGAGAALFMALTHSLLRTYTAAYPDDPARVLHETNQRLLADSSRALFVTLFYGVLEVETGRLAYCNAGHNPPYYVPAESHNHLQLLALTGIPLGIDPDATWQSRELALQPGGLLVLYTDGVTEAQNEHGAYFGESPLEERLQTSRGARAQTVLEALSADLAAFVGAAPQTDDITLLVLRRAD